MKNFDRPFNIDNNTIINKLVGYIDMRCDDDTDARVFVTRNDVVVTKVVSDKTNEESPDKDCNSNPDNFIYYKYFTERKIQAILQLDSWMYTLSNPCAIFNLSKKANTDTQQEKQ